MVEYIEYNDKKYPVRVNYIAIKRTQSELKEKTGKKVTLEDILGEELDVMEAMLFHALVRGHKVENQEMTLKREDMEEVLDSGNNFHTFSEILVNFFQKGGTETQQQTNDLKKDGAQK